MDSSLLIVAIVTSILGPLASVVAIIVGISNLSKNNREEKKKREEEAAADAAWRTGVSLKLDSLDRTVQKVADNHEASMPRIEKLEKDAAVLTQRVDVLEKKRVTRKGGAA